MHFEILDVFGATGFMQKIGDLRLAGRMDASVSSYVLVVERLT